MGSKTTQLKGTGQYVGPDTSNQLYQQLQTGGKYDPAQWMNQGMGSYMAGIGATSDLYGQGVSAAQGAYGQGLQALQGGIGSQVGGLQDIARSTAEGALSQYGTSARELAQQQSRSAMENVASEYAGSGALNSGAALKAVGAGAAQPLLQAETDIAQQYGNLYGQTANSLYGNAYQNLGQQANMYGQQGQTLAGLYGQQAGQLGSLYGNLGAQQYGIGSQYAGLLGQLGQSSYIAPQYQTKQGLGGQIVGGLTSGVGTGLGIGLGSGIGRLFG